MFHCIQNVDLKNRRQNKETNKLFTFSHSLQLEIPYNTCKKEKQRMTYCIWWEAGKKM